MAGAVRSRPNHYETLGLTPTASAEEIARAFSRELRRPRPIGGIAPLSVAYETLRSAAKRRAYDASLGLAHPPQPVFASWVTTSRVRAPLVHAATIATVERQPVKAIVAPPSREVNRQSPPHSSESRLPIFLAKSLRDKTKPQPLGGIAEQKLEPEQRFVGEWEAKPKIQASSNGRVFDRVAPPAFKGAEDEANAWKGRAAMIVGLAAIAGLVGLWAAWDPGLGIKSRRPLSVVTASLPPAKPFLTGTLASPTASHTSMDMPPPEAPQAEVAAARLPQSAPLPQPNAVGQQVTPEIPTSDLGAAQGEEIPSALASPDATTSSPAVAPVSAIPLPEKVIARTIEQIGYSCGQVTSILAVDGAPRGVFKVTCTSGQTYRASPVSGRYHFRRWARQSSNY